MIVLVEYSLETIRPLLGLEKPRVSMDTPEGPYLIKTSSTRLECFRRNVKCVSCGISGNVWRLERHRPGRQETTDKCYAGPNCPGCTPEQDPNIHVKGDTPHFNLYHKDRLGNYILMTQDHIIPKSRGGSNAMSNLATMCHICNETKGNMSDRSAFRQRYYDVFE